MEAAHRSFTQYVATVVALNAKYFGRLRRVAEHRALGIRRIGRDEPAEERWYGEGGNLQTAASRHLR